jgi:hypothetical protein
MLRDHQQTCKLNLEGLDLPHHEHVPALLLLDSFEPAAHQQLRVWSIVATHGFFFWIVKQMCNSVLLQFYADSGARLSASLDARSLVVHDATCWSNDAETAGFVMQLCMDAGKLSNAPPLIIPPLLGSWEALRYDFHWRDGSLPEPLRLHQEHQQDAL